MVLRAMTCTQNTFAIASAPTMWAARTRVLEHPTGQ